MNLRRITIAVVVLLSMGPIVSAAPAQDEAPRLGVLRFTNQTSAGWWSASVGRELSDMLAAELANTGSFQVLERGEIEAVLGEQDLGASGRIDSATKAKIGRIKGAQYLVAATVSSYQEETRGSGGKVRLGGISVGAKQDKSYIAIDLKLIDTTTGVIADARTIEAEATGQGLGAGLSIRNFSLSGGGYEKTPAGKAIRACVLYLAEYLECSLLDGPDSACMKKWNDMEKKRQNRTKDAITIR